MLPFRNTTRDLSTELSDLHEWKQADFRQFNSVLDASALAFDPVSGLLAVGSRSGKIRIIGQSAVDLTLDNGAGIKFLQFAVSVFKLVCIDQQNRLRIWNLAKKMPSQPEASTSCKHTINAVITSPSHNHVLIALQSGEVQAYDLITLAWSPQVSPNLWKIHEQKLLATGFVTEAEPESQEAIDLLMHPRDLGTLFIGYDGGVVICDVEHHTLRRVFEIVLPPGAPGGHGYNSPNVLTYRRPSVTSIAIHPTGHMIAVGHVDGMISFWAIEDDERPLLCMTLDEMDVNNVDVTKLESTVDRPAVTREPIFKLAWGGFTDTNDPRGGDTTLTVLGGTDDEAMGIHVLLLPALRPKDSQEAASASPGLPPQYRKAMRQAVTPKQSYFYSTYSYVQDFLLMPSESPYFGGNMDAKAILLLMEAPGNTRAIEARKFPPPHFIVAPELESATKTGNSNLSMDIEAELAATLADMRFNDEPPLYALPSSLWSGKTAITSPELIKLERDAHYKLTIAGLSPPQELSISGGLALSRAKADTQLIKFQPHRIIMTQHHDLTIRFQDLDARLLAGTEESHLQTSFPKPLHDLTIDVASLLSEPSLASQIPSTLLLNARITCVELARETLDCAIALQTGEVVVYRLPSPLDQEKNVISDSQPGSELISLVDIVVSAPGRFQPIALLNARRGSVTCLSVSDIGLIAVAFEDGSLYIIHTEGPSILLRELPTGRKEQRSIFQKTHALEPIKSLSWTVCGVKKDPFPRIRLIGVRSSGHAMVYTLDRQENTSKLGVISSSETEGVPSPFSDPDCSVVISAETGLKYKADGHAVRSANQAEITNGIETKHSIWINAGEKGARTMIDVTGDRLSRIEWGNKGGSVVRARVVEKSDSAVLVAFTDKCQAFVYSLPELHLLHRLDLPYQDKSAPLITADTTGDYLLSRVHPGTPFIETSVYGSLFSQRRSYYVLPQIQLDVGRGQVPPQPQPVSVGQQTMLGSLLGYVGATGTLSGDQIDTILYGGARPTPTLPSGSQNTNESDVKSGTSETKFNMPDVGAVGTQMSQGASAWGTQIGQGASAMFGRLNNALSERGEMLDSLQNSMRSLEQGTQNAVNQAKVAAAKQTARGWFSTF